MRNLLASAIILICPPLIFAFGQQADATLPAAGGSGGSQFYAR